MSHAPVKAPCRAVSADDPTLSLPEQLDLIASELNLLFYIHTQPEAFMERRNELVVRLRRLARRVARDPATVVDLTVYRASSATPARAPGRSRTRTIIVRRL